LKTFQFTVIIDRQPEGEYLVSVPALPGCYTEGRTLEESREMAADAIRSDLLISSTAPQDSDEPVSQANLDNIDKTLMSEVVRHLAYTWIAMLVMNPVGLIATILFR
jgi:antitoxin HicB